MNRISRLLLPAAVAGLICQAQTQVNLQTQAKNVDFSQAPSTKPFTVGATLPATCEVGQAFFNTSAAAGANWYGCVAANVWTVQSGSSGGITQLSGDVAAGPGSGAQTATIQPGSLTLNKMANLAADSIICNNTGSAATPIACTPAQVNAMLGVSGGGSGNCPASGSPAGVVPASNGSGACKNTSITDNGTTVSMTEPIALTGSTSGTATIEPQAAAGTPTLTLPNTTGTFAVGASSPLSLNATTGNLTCPTCATTTNGGALSATSPVTISAAGVIACSTCSTATINSGSQYNLAYYSASGSSTTVSGLSNGTAKQILVAGSPDNYIDYPDVKVVPTAVCNAGTAGPAWTIPSSGGFSVACRAGTNNLLGALQGTPSSGATAYFDFELPGDWDTTNQPYVQIFYGSGSNTSGTVIFTVSTACMGAEAGGTTDDPSFNANSAFSTQTMATANRAWAVSGKLTAVTSGNNCDAGSNMIVKVVLSGTASSAINVYKASVTVPRLLTVQAN
ncbi:MAG TPA: hypothetical protein VIY49_09990 [Bryobacteraceae bacterium]